MEDEWTKVISGDRLIKFTYADLPEGEAFVTAQLAGHDVADVVKERWPQTISVRKRGHGGDPE